MKYLIFIALILVALVANAQEEEYKKKPPVFNRIIKNMTFEVMGMRSITLQKEPFPLVPLTTYSNNLSGYIPIPSCSFQLGVLKENKLINKFYLKSGIHYKFIYKKFKKVAPWTPIIPGINSTLYQHQKSYFLTLSNYLFYDLRNYNIGLGFNAFALYTNENSFPPDIEKYYSILIRIERQIELLENEIELISEAEGRGKKWNYYQIKFGFNFKIK